MTSASIVLVDEAYIHFSEAPSALNLVKAGKDPSESNCFLLDTKRPGQGVRDAMAKENVMIGRVWPFMPTWVRITVGTAEEMSRFQSALQKVMKA